jgi:exonuclease SbcC
MRLESIKIRNLGPFRDFSVDLTELPASALLIAVAGPNGAGKSTLLELATGGTAYRECETRGALKKLATARDAVLETTLVNGQRWTIRHSVDAVSGNGTALVLDASHAPAYESTKLPDFKAWSAKHLPPPEILYSSLVSVQENRGFIAQGRGERKAILLRALGVERLERLAKDARDRAAEAQRTVDRIDTSLAVERRNAECLDQLQQERAAARGEAEHAQRVRDDTRTELQEARAAVAAYQAARQAYQTAVEARERLASRLAAERDRAGRLDSLLADRSAALGRVNGAAQVLEQARAELQAARSALASYEADKRAYEVASAARADLERRVGDARQKSERAEKLVANNRALLAEADAIRVAVARVEAIHREQAEARAEGEADKRDADAAWERVRSSESQMTMALAATAAAKDRATKARARLGDLDKVKAAAASLDEWRATVSRSATEVAEADSALDALRSQRLLGAEERVLDLRTALTEIHESEADTAGTLRALAGGAIERDDQAIQAAENVPREVARAAERLREAADTLSWARRNLSDTEALAARLPDVESATSDLEAAEAEQRQHSEAATRYRDEAHQHTVDAEAHTDRARAAGQREELATVDEGTATLAAKAEHLIGVEQRLADREHQASEARAELERLISEFARTPVPEQPAAPPDVARLERAARSAQQELETRTGSATELDAGIVAAQEAARRAEQLQSELDTMPPPTRPSEPISPERLEQLEQRASDEHETAVRRGARLDQAIQAAQEAAGRAAGLEVDLRAAHAELADWTRLGKDLGRDGLQAMLVDSACAELTALCNDLLHEAFGPRWSVSFETQRLDSKGKRQLEGMDVRVLDTERGRDDFVESYSGGERTVLGEAVSLALTVLACRRYGFDRPTLVRDETSAALDPEKAVAYVAMLRRAAQMIDADRVLLVSHSPDVQELCDARIELGGSDA